MKGRRIYPTDFSSLEGIEPGDYWKNPDHGWFAACPISVTGIPATGNDLLLATLCKHTVIEHEDGTITVNPSILVGGNYSGIASREWVDKHTWHGWLERGEWRTA
jgi:hypothetical protein